MNGVDLINQMTNSCQKSGKESETPIIDLAPKMFMTIKRAQDALSKWIVPDSGISDHEVLNELLGILDDSDLVSKMNKILPPNEIKAPSMKDLFNCLTNKP